MKGAFCIAQAGISNASAGKSAESLFRAAPCDTL